MKWIEDEVRFARRVFRAIDFDAMYRAIKHKNIVRQKKKRPVMKGIRIQALAEYDGEHSGIIGIFSDDMALDSGEKMV